MPPLKATVKPVSSRRPESCGRKTKLATTAAALTAARVFSFFRQIAADFSPSEHLVPTIVPGWRRVRQIWPSPSIRTHSCLMTGDILGWSLQTLRQEKQPNYGLLLKRANQNREEAATRYAAAATIEPPGTLATLGEGGEAKMMADVMPSG